MSWFTSLRDWLVRPRQPDDGIRIRKEPRRVLMTAECVMAITDGLEAERTARHEGIVYLLGVAGGSVTLIAGAVRPAATTTAGSFEVSPRSMAAVIRTASSAGLHVVGQLHTHPGAAYHSQGDECGAWIRFPGFTSIVVPSYGDALPDLAGAAVFVTDGEGAFREISSADVRVLPRGGLWRT